VKSQKDLQPKKELNLSDKVTSNNIGDLNIEKISHLCDYGCGQEAKYQFKNGKWCCKEHWQSCLAKGRVHSEKTKEKMRRGCKRKKSPIYVESSGRVCDYGCGREAKYQFKNGKWCCEDNLGKCPVKRKEKSNINKMRKSPKYIKESGHVCDFGCGRPAHYLFKSGNWCCEKRCESCPVRRKENGERKKGVVVSEENRKKLSVANKGRVFSKEARKNMSNAQKGKKHSEEARKNMSNAHKGITSSIETRKKMSGRIPWNKGNIGMCSKDTRKKMSEAKKYTIKDYQEKYPLFCKVEELRENPKTGEIQAHCKNHNCKNSRELGGWFTPTTGQLSERHKSIEYDGCYLYCSEECKNSCELFNKSAIQLIKQDKIKAGLIEDSGHEGDAIWRQEVIKRNIEEHGQLQCEICGNTNENELSAHHEKPRKTHPEMSLDPDNGWILCSFGKGNNCHLRYGHPEGTNCSTWRISQINL
jgi:hypothetical protein